MFHFHRPGGIVLPAVIIISLLCFTGIFMSEAFRDANEQNLDERLFLSFRNPADITDPIGPHVFEELMRDITAFGGAAILGFLTIVLGLYLVFINRKRMATYLVLSISGGIALSLLLKELFNRPRPDLVPHESIVITSSFPSGHSMMSAITYLTIAAILARVEPRPHLKLYFYLLAVLLTFLVGVSRVYLGVHWPSDVFAGWALGALFALIFRHFGISLQKKGRIEQEGVRS